jgi:hypothetical protein
MLPDSNYGVHSGWNVLAALTALCSTLLCEVAWRVSVRSVIPLKLDRRLCSLLSVRCDFLCDFCVNKMESVKEQCVYVCEVLF